MAERTPSIGLTAWQERYQKMHRRAQRAESRAAQQDVQIARAYRMLRDWRRNHEMPKLYEPLDPCRVGAWLAFCGYEHPRRIRTGRMSITTGPRFNPKASPLDTVPDDLSPTRCQAGAWGAP